MHAALPKYGMFRLFGLGRSLDAIECYTIALRFSPIGEEHANDKVTCHTLFSSFELIFASGDLL